MGFCRRELLIFVLEGRELGQIQNSWEGMCFVFFWFHQQKLGFGRFWGFSPPPPRAPEFVVVRTQQNFHHFMNCIGSSLRSCRKGIWDASRDTAGDMIQNPKSYHTHWGAICNVGSGYNMETLLQASKKTYDLSKLWWGIKVSSESKSYLSYLQQPQIVTGQLYIYPSFTVGELGGSSPVSAWTMNHNPVEWLLLGYTTWFNGGYHNT